MGRPRTKLPRRTPKDRIDALIDWYQRNTPGGGPDVIPVHMNDKTLERFAERGDGGRWKYRNRTLVRE